jgi:hypothetical protein
LTYSAPKAWKELPAKGFRVAAFEISEGGQKAEVTVIPLGGQAGTLLANVNRWREQLGLSRIDAEQLQKEMRTLKVAGIGAPYLDLSGPENRGQRLRILAVSVPHGGQTWFFKMTGQAEVVGRERDNFEAFVASVRFSDSARK